MTENSSPRKIGAGVFQAAGRQGISEIGQALKAFPDSIQVHEPGTLFSPTQGEIAEANRTGSLESRIREGYERQATEKQPPEKGFERD